MMFAKEGMQVAIAVAGHVPSAISHDANTSARPMTVFHATTSAAGASKQSALRLMPKTLVGQPSTSTWMWHLSQDVPGK